MPSWVDVRKKMLGFIRGEETTNARIALNGTPPGSNERPTGMAAYVGSGEMRPTSDAETMDHNSLFWEKESLRLLKYRAAPTLRAMLMRTYGPTMMKRSTKFSRILSV
jgi:hypothetical protein